MEEFHNKKGWLEEEIERTKVYISTTRLKDLMETVRAYTANEEPVLDIHKPFQLWTHFQDEPPGIFEGFYEREVAIARGCEYSLKPIIYGTVTLRSPKGHILVEFQDGAVLRDINDYPLATTLETRGGNYYFNTVLFDGNRNRNDDILLGPIEIKPGTPVYKDGVKIGETVSVKKWNDPRPSWDATFISEAFRISRRSLDKHTKCGCVLVKDNRIVSTGYNSPPPGFDDSKADLERPGKYIIMEHAERNAICNAARSGVRTLGATAYITGFPCSDCYRAMWNAGIDKIIYAPVSLEYFTNDHIARLQAANTGPKLIPFSKEQMKEVIKILDDEYDYIMERVFGEINTPVSAPSL